MGLGCLFHIVQPCVTALVFVRTVLQPWRAYLARYPDVPLVIVIGDDSDEKFFQPQPSDLAELAA